MVGGGRRHRAAGPVPEGRPSGPRPSAVSRTTGSEAPGGRIYTLTRHSRPPGTPSRSFISFPSKFHCRFSSLHFLEDSFIRIPFPFRPCIFLQLGFSPAPSSFSCNAFHLHLFPFSPVFRIASMHGIIRIIRDDAGNAGGVAQPSIRHPQKILVFGLVFGCCGEMLQKSPKPIRKSFAPYKGGPSPKRTRMVGAWSAHGRRHGARGLIPEGKP